MDTLMRIDFLFLQELPLRPPVTSNAITEAEHHMRSTQRLSLVRAIQTRIDVLSLVWIQRS